MDFVAKTGLRGSENKKNICLILSSPELRVQVSLSDHPSYVVLPFVRVSVCKLFTFSSFPPEPLGKFHQTWHKVFLSKGYSAYFKRWTTPFSKGEIITNSILDTLTKFKDLSIRITWSNLSQKYYLVKGLLTFIQQEINTKIINEI